MLILYTILFILAIILISHIYIYLTTSGGFGLSSKSSFQNSSGRPYIPYLTHNLVLKIYTTSTAEFNKYKYMNKATLKNNMIISNGVDNVFIPKTVKNIPIQLYRNSDRSRMIIVANSIEHEINPNQLILTTF